jgi:hypothetical protein
VKESRYLFDADRVGSSFVLLDVFVMLGILGGLLAWVGVVGWLLRRARLLFTAFLSNSFQLWRRLLSWANWIAALVLTVILLGLGIELSSHHPYLALLCGGTLLFIGTLTTLAYIYIDLERDDVARGYKALHSPMKGQELATNLVRYGRQIGVPLLAVSTVGMVGSFALAAC